MRLCVFLTYANIVDKKYTRKSKINGKINILLSGFTNPDNKDLDGLIKLLDYLYDNSIDLFKFHVVNYYPLEELDVYGDLCKVYVDLKAKEMMKLLAEVDYVMTLTRKNSSYHRKQLTGIIPLAISMGVPLIIDKDLAHIYEVSPKNSVVYPFTGVNTIKKTVLSLISISPSKYNSLKKGVLSYRKKMVSHYQKKMKSYVKKILEGLSH